MRSVAAALLALATGVLLSGCGDASPETGGGEARLPSPPGVRVSAVSFAPDPTPPSGGTPRIHLALAGSDVHDGKGTLDLAVRVEDIPSPGASRVLASLEVGEPGDARYPVVHLQTVLPGDLLEHGGSPSYELGTSGLRWADGGVSLCDARGACTGARAGSGVAFRLRFELTNIGRERLRPMASFTGIWLDGAWTPVAGYGGVVTVR